MKVDATLRCGFEDQPPWRGHRDDIAAIVRWAGQHVETAFRNKLGLDLSEAAYSAITSILQCIIYRGELDPFHQMVWEVYEAGGFPCGWEGPLEQLEDGRLDVTDVRLYVLWMENDPPDPPTRQA